MKRLSAILSLFFLPVCAGYIIAQDHPDTAKKGEYGNNREIRPMLKALLAQ